MVNVTEEEKEFVIKNFGENYLYGEVDDLLEKLDDWIGFYGFDKGWVFNDEGRRVQRMYDNIYYNN